ncbi:MAG: DUF4965 domain-containing protein [Candidatus Hydrogenedentes bacterium]|nr:DUF4965 domain-containing protein [Candidatus Hydrogenedentota bacterium]
MVIESILPALGMCLLCGTSLLPPDFTPPAVPLIVHDPYTSTWIFGHDPVADWTRHWTGKERTLAGLIRIDGETYRFLGPREICEKALSLVKFYVYPTRTIYTYENEKIRLVLTFTTPMLPYDYKYLSAPVTFIEFETTSKDVKEHTIEIYLDVGIEWCVDSNEQMVTWEKPTPNGNITLLKAGSVEQPILEKSGDNRRIDWGYLYLVVPSSPEFSTKIGQRNKNIAQFNSDGRVYGEPDINPPIKPAQNSVALSSSLSISVPSNVPVSRYLVIAYDDIYSIEFFGEKLRPWYYKEYGEDFILLLNNIYKEYPNIKEKCSAWDEEVLSNACGIVGKQYSALVGLTYRHVFGSGKIVVGKEGRPLYFHKENFSNGCIATVDVSYPASPFFALFAPALLRGMLEPIFLYARTPDWIFEFAPHDVGTYPKANGQVYGRENGKLLLESQMPVEECGNMILMTALLAEAEGSIEYAREHWDLLEKWANYLKEHGRDPENQLCTDDFAGHLAHNTNLSLKAIVALGAFAKLSKQRHLAYADEWEKLAREMAQDWVHRARDGDKFKLTFDRPGTWSMKYNLVWDKILNLNLFSPEIARLELAHYKKVQNTYGLPLDCRKDYTKVDWLIWCATLTQSREDFDALYQPFYRFLNETPDKIPLTDWYDTKTAKCIGFRARPVIGGIFLPYLYHEKIWKEFANKSQKF